MYRKSPEVIWKSISCLTLALGFAILAPGTASAQACDDNARAQFASAVAAGTPESALEQQFGHCRYAFTEPVCTQTSSVRSASKGLSSSGEKIKTVTNFNTFYERMNGCGYHPQSEVVACDVEIRQLTGYGAFPGGSFERVRFCLDCDRNGTWDFSTVGSVHVTNNVAMGPTPSWYHLAFAGTAAAPALCVGNDGQQTNVRAILSWVWVPPNCNSVPFWGNIINFTARRDP